MYNFRENILYQNWAAGNLNMAKFQVRNRKWFKNWSRSGQTGDLTIHGSSLLLNDSQKKKLGI